MQIVALTQRLSLLLLIFFVYTPLNAAQSKVFEGDALPEPLSIELDFNGADYVLVTASQKSADYVLSLEEGESTEVLKTIDTSAGKFMDEVLFVKKSACTICIVTLSPRESIDQKSRYKLVFRNFTESSIDSNKNRDLIEILDSISLMGELSFKASAETPARALEIRKEAVAIIRGNVSKDTVSPLAQKWQARSKTLLLLLMAEMRNPEGAIELARSIIDHTSDETIDDVIFAYYDLAALSSDALQSMELYLQGMSLAKSAGNDLAYAYAANRVAIQLVHQAKFDQALKQFEQVQEIYHSNKNDRALLDMFSNLSWGYLRAGNIPKSIASAAEHKLFAEQQFAEVEVIWALYNMALAYGEIGERYQADNILDNALSTYYALSEGRKEDTQQLYGALLRERAETLRRLGDFESAKDFVKQSQKFFIDRNRPAEIAGTKYVEGEIAIAQGLYPQARVLIEESIDFEEKNNRHRNAGLRYLGLAELEMLDGQLIKAAEYQKKALGFLTETQDQLSKAVAFSQSIELLTLLGQPDKAKVIAERISGFVNRFGPERDKVEFGYRLAKVEFELGNYRTALGKLAEARRVIDETLPKVRRRDLRQHYFALQKKIFELNLNALVDTGEHVQALRLLESYKARTLKELIVQVDDGVSFELAAERDEVHKRILGNADALYSSDKSDHKKVLAETRRLTSKLQKLESEFEIAQLRNLTAVEFASEVPKVSQSGELLAYYFIGSENSWVWLVSSGGYEVFNLPPESELVDLISSLKSTFSTHPSNRNGVSAWQQKKQQRALSKILLSPMNDRLLDGSVANLTIVSDGPLDGFPFGALMLDGAEGPLIEHVAISHIPSSGSQQALLERTERRGGRASNSGILVVANPVGDHSQSPQIVPLPYSVVEAEQIENKFAENAKLVLGKEAHKKSVIPLVSSGHSILHFATHGLLNSKEPSLSGLMFSKTTEEPNYWLAPEISRSNLHADLVVLSACESSIGKGVPGEGMFSLSRAFIEAGASHVIGSLWKVEDASTADLMGNFYSALLDDSLPISLALQRAQLATYSNVNNDWRDPYFWAGFQLQGGWNTLSYGRKQDT